MDNNRVSDTNKKSDDFFLTIENGLTEDKARSQKKVDAFFDKLEANKYSRIKDDPKESEGARFVTRDNDVVVFRSDGDKGQVYKVKEQPKQPPTKSNGKGVKKAPPVKNNAGPSKKPSSNDRRVVQKPARKKSLAVRIIGVIYGIIWRFILIMMILATIAGCAVAILGSTYLINVTKDDDLILNLYNVELTYSSMLMVKEIDKNGEENWVEYQRIFGGENRIWLKYTDMPTDLINAIVASEDQRFWEHEGVDWKRTIAAFVNAYVPGIDLFSGSQGGSTLAQQLIKNITDEDETEGLDGALRKLREIYRALIMEKKYSREQILESYLNTFRLSGQVAGIEAGANYYFDKTTSQLSVAECAAIVCITKAPGAFNPYSYPDENRIQRDTIINQMYEQGYLTTNEWNRAKSESARMVFTGPPAIQTGTNIYPYFADMVIDELLEDFVKYEFQGCKTTDDAYRLLTRGGLRVMTTLDTSIQDVLDDVRLNGRRRDDDERGAYPGDPDGYLYPRYASRPAKDVDGSYIIDSDGNRVMDDTQPQSAFGVMDMKGEIKGVV
ncbi:MAG: penicillin-binding protein, partial [Oscillospiraceae bacterium]|nr:penicillin-binding protein [Oscillospiraceae bacterium]